MISTTMVHHQQHQHHHHNYHGHDRGTQGSANGWTTRSVFAPFVTSRLARRWPTGLSMYILRIYCIQCMSVYKKVYDFCWSIYNIYSKVHAQGWRGGDQQVYVCNILYSLCLYVFRYILCCWALHIPKYIHIFYSSASTLKMMRERYCDGP